MLIEMGQTGVRKAATSFSAADNEQKTPSERARLLEVLSELYELLEDYSPTWYTEEHHRRIQSALHMRKQH